MFDKVGDGARLLERFSELADGKWVEEYWNRAERYWKGVWADTTATADKMLERISELANDRWVEEYWNSPERAAKYWRGVWANAARGASMLERYTTAFDGTTVVEIWNDAGEYGKSVFDKVGRLISKTGIGVPNLPDLWPF